MQDLTNEFGMVTWYFFAAVMTAICQKQRCRKTAVEERVVADGSRIPM
jgi:hypothetical protein